MIIEVPIAAIVGVLVAIIGHILIFRADKKTLHPPLGMEETSIQKFQANIARNTMMSGARFLGHSAPHLNRGIAQTRAIAATLNPEQHARPTSAKVSAERLVKGIAFRNKVTLFMAGPIDQATENDQILLDIFGALTVAPKCVDVSSDADMHLGLPQSKGIAELPYLYIDGIAFGNFGAILEAVQDGSLTTALDDAGIAIETSAAQCLRKA